MTVSSDVAKIVHVTALEVTNYTFPFKIFEAGQLSASVVEPATHVATALSLNTHYTISPAGLNQDVGGEIVMTAAGRAEAGTGNNLVLLRYMGFVQETDYRPYDVFPAATHERALDVLTMQDQELREMIGRAIIAPADQDEAIQYDELEVLRNEAAAARDEAQASALLARAAAGRVDGVIEEIKNLTAEAGTLEPGEAATAEYDPATGVLCLGLPRGPAGRDGSGVNILGVAVAPSELPAEGGRGDAWLVGDDLYIWDAAGLAWVNGGPIRGQKGDQGPKGDKGDQGEPGHGDGFSPGMFMFFLCRQEALPAGWHYPSGEYVPQDSALGAALLALPDQLKSDWGVTVSGANISLFNNAKFFSGNLGRFPRMASGTGNYQPGVVETDAIRNITGSLQFSSVDALITPSTYANSVASGAFSKTSSATKHGTARSSATGIDAVFNFNASNSVTTATENRPYSVHMTPAIYLGV